MSGLNVPVLKDWVQREGFAGGACIPEANVGLFAHVPVDGTSTPISLSRTGLSFILHFSVFELT